MADKRGKKEKGSGGAGEDFKREQKLQAILLADSFSKTFRPITWESPKVLLPLVNVPMLEYTIEFLAQNGVEELFVFCVWHAKEVQAYIDKSRWPSLLKVVCISSAQCLSAGDALRELDAQDVIRSDPFILISGDVISNMDLKKAIAYHKEKRKQDSNAIMTVVLKEVQQSSGIKSVLDDLVVMFDNNSSQLLMFEDSYKRRSVDVPVEVMMEHSNLAFRTDLLDCHIDICSPELMLQFSDNFDYQDIRKDFIRNEVLNFALGKTFYGYILQNEYAARVNDFRTYHAICRDYVSRWVYPLVPDAQTQCFDSNYVHLKRYVYKEPGVKIARSAKIGEGVVLGRGAVVGEGVVLERCVVGRDCVIGNFAYIVESHLWAGVVVETGAVISEALLCDKVLVKKNAKVGRGCVLSYGVVVGENVHLPDYTRVSRLERCIEGCDATDKWGGNTSSSSSSSFSSDESKAVLGEDGKGYVWTYHGSGDYDEDAEEEEDDDDEIAAGNEGADGTLAMNRPAPVIAQSIGCREGELWKSRLWSTIPQPADENSDDEDDSMQDEDPNEAFYRIISDIVLTGRLEGHPPDNLLMEIKGYKFAQNKTFSDCLRAVMPSILDISLQSGTQQMAIVKSLQDLLKEGGWGHNLLKALTQEPRDELTIIESAEDHVLLETKSDLYPLFRFVLQFLYDSDLVSEETFLKWISRHENSDDLDSEGAKEKLFRQPKVQEFVSWLQEEDDDDEDDDDDDEEEEDD